jgi:hypothetical protein
MTDVAITAEFLDRGVGNADLEALLVAAASTSLVFPNDGNVFVVIKNASVGSVTATLEGVKDPYGALQDEALTILASKIAIIPFANRARFNAQGRATLTLSASASVSVGFFRMTKAN